MNTECFDGGNEKFSFLQHMVEGKKIGECMALLTCHYFCLYICSQEAFFVPYHCQ